MKKYILGLGTGRCGTVSLAKLLNNCANVNVSHEWRERNDANYRLSWKYSSEEIINRCNKIHELKGNLVGDIAHFYLPYITFLQEHFKDNIKFIYLERDAEETVQSFMKKSKNWCHWISKDSKVFIENNYKAISWDRTFPKYNTNSKEEAIERYVYEYHDYANALFLNNSNMLKIKTENLSCKSTIKQIFDFLEILEEDRNYNMIWENKNE